MKIIRLKSALIMIFVILGCNIANNEYKKSCFTFNFDGKKYQIISAIKRVSTGYNALTQRDGKRTVLQAVDNDQNGELDTLMLGEITLEKANEIYAIGIAKAKATGKYQEQFHPRAYKKSDKIQTYVFQTVIPKNGNIYNRFIILTHSARSETITLDIDADGNLEKVLHGEYEPAFYQKFYNMILENGLNEGAIEKKYDMYFARSK